MRKRRVIQISTDVVENTMTIHALCDDGTIWLKVGQESWHPVDVIPQPGPLPDPFENLEVVEREMPKISEEEEK